MNKQKLLNILKWLWTALIIIGVGYYFSKNYQTNIAYIKNISIGQFLLSAGLLVVAKIFLAEMSRQSVISNQWKPSYSKMFHLNSTIQLSKYLPGGVWHFVGRFGVYRVNGLDNKQASQSMIVENAWLVSSAFLFGALVCLANGVSLQSIGLPSGAPLRVGLIVISGVIWIIINYSITRLFLKQQAQPGHIFKQLLVQGATWLFIGLSFFVLLPTRIMSFGTATLSIGGFAIGWALGYITIFAPSGIGIREAVITAILATYIQPQEAAIYAALSRLVWIITEIGLSIFAELKFGSGNLSNLLKPGKENQVQ